MKTCSVDNCKNNLRSKNLCGKHYARFKRYGDVNFVTLEKDRISNNRQAQPKLRKAKPSSYLKFFGKHEHRVVMEQKLGRKLKRNEIVHHIDHNRHNNHPDNLQVMTQREHWQLHKKEIIEAIKKKPKKTHCPQGHEYNEKNSGVNKKSAKT